MTPEELEILNTFAGAAGESRVFARCLDHCRRRQHYRAKGARPEHAPQCTCGFFKSELAFQAAAAKVGRLLSDAGIIHNLGGE
jgi:hypothetical protein